MDAEPDQYCPYCESGDPFKSPAGSESYHVVPVVDGHTYKRCEADVLRAPAEPGKGEE